MNEICIEINDDQDNSSKAEEIYVAAIANNGLHEFHDFAADDELPSLEGDIEILITTWFATASGVAPMWHHSGAQDMFLEFLDTYFSPIPVATLLQFGRPDIVIYFGDNFDDTPTENFGTDDFRSTVYHELGHALHFFQVGNIWWEAFRNHNIDNNIWSGGYGSPGNFAPISHPGVCSLAEGWGFHIGDLYADRKYGLNHSNDDPNPSNQLGQAATTFLELLEERRL